MSKPPKPTVAQRLGEADPVLSMGQRVWDFISGQWPAITTFFATGGGVTILALLTEWARALGPLGIGLIAIGAAFAGLISVSQFQATLAKRRLRHEQLTMVSKWKDDVDTINPLSPEFHTKRIKLSELFNPITKLASNKRLIDCELVGPANIMFLAKTPNNMMTGVTFFGCDIVVVKENMPLMNVFAFEDLNMIGGAIYNCTLFIPGSMVPAFRAFDGIFATLTGDPEIDNLPLPGIGVKIQP